MPLFLVGIVLAQVSVVFVRQLICCPSRADRPNSLTMKSLVLTDPSFALRGFSLPNRVYGFEILKNNTLDFWIFWIFSDFFPDFFGFFSGFLGIFLGVRGFYE